MGVQVPFSSIHIIHSCFLTSNPFFLHSILFSFSFFFPFFWGEDFASILFYFWGNFIFKFFLSTLLFWKISIHGFLLGHQIVFLNLFFLLWWGFLYFYLNNNTTTVWVRTKREYLVGLLWVIYFISLRNLGAFKY